MSNIAITNIDTDFLKPEKQQPENSKKPSTFRYKSEQTLATLQTVNAFLSTYENVIKKISQQDENYSIDQLIAFLCIFSCSNSALGYPNKLLAFINDLIMQKIHLKKCPRGFFIDIYQHNESHEQIHISHPYRWFVDPVTLSLVLKIMDCLKNSKATIRRYENQKMLWIRVKKELTNVTKNTINNLSSFCKAGVNYASVSLFPKLPQYLNAYAIGELQSFSQDATSFERRWRVRNTQLLQDNNPNEEVINIAEASNVHSGITNLKKQRFHSINIFRDVFLKELRDLLRFKKSEKDFSYRSHRIDKLSELISDLKDDSELILVNWLLSIVNDRNVQFSTAYTYLSNIGEYWLTQLEGKDIYELDEADMTDFIDELENEYSGTKSLTARKERLKDLLVFSAQKFDTTLPFMEKVRKLYVRNYLICEQDFRTTLQASLNLAGNGSQFRECIFIALLLMGRIGLRPSEVVKLTVNDFEESDQIYVFIRQNKFGKNKTSSAARKIPVALFMQPDELELFRSYLLKRRHRNQSTSKNPLFIPPNFVQNMPFSIGELNRQLKQIMEGICGTDLVAYHLRHMAITNMQVSVLPDVEVAIELSPYDKVQLEKLREFFKRSSDRDECWNIAALAGHINPTVTFYHYMHLTDLLLNEYIQQNTKSYPITFWKNISNACFKSFNNLERDELISGNEAVLKINEYANKQNLISCIYHQQTDVHEPLVKNKKTPTYLDCLEALKHFDSHIKPQQIAQMLSLDLHYIEKWIKNALDLSKLKTSKGKSRLLPNDSGRLSPIRPKTHKEIERAHQIIEAIRNLYSNQTDELMFVLKYVVNNITQTKSYIKFTQPNDYFRFMAFLSQVTDPTDWSVAIEIPGSSCRSHLSRWRVRGFTIKGDIVNIGKKPSPKYSIGIAKLHFVNQSMAIISGYARYSSNIITYVCHLLLVMLGLVKK